MYRKIPQMIFFSALSHVNEIFTRVIVKITLKFLSIHYLNVKQVKYVSQSLNTILTKQTVILTTSLFFHIFFKFYSWIFCLYSIQSQEAATFAVFMIALRLSLRIIFNSKNPLLSVLQFNSKD